jgi:hypothetical protein
MHSLFHLMPAPCGSMADGTTGVVNTSTHKGIGEGPALDGHTIQVNGNNHPADIIGEAVSGDNIS